MALAKNGNTPRNIRAAAANLRNVLNITEAMFRHRRTLNDSAYETCLTVGKQILNKCKKDRLCRTYLADSQEIWDEFSSCFATAMPEIVKQSFVNTEPNMQTLGSPGSSNADVMITNYMMLTKDLERLNDLWIIARNLIATTSHVQNMACKAHLDQKVLKYVDICVRVTARGYDGDGNVNGEAQWTTILGLFKKLLITCLQFLHNLIQQNDQRKLLVWLDLFGNSSSTDVYFSAKISRRAAGKQRAEGVRQISNDRELVHDEITSEDAHQEKATAIAILDAAAALAHARLNGDTAESIQDHTASSQDDAEGHQLVRAQEASADRDQVEEVDDYGWTSLPFVVDPEQSDEIQATDTMILKTPESAAKILNTAKEQLLAKLQNPTLSELRSHSRNIHDDGAEAFNDEGRKYTGYIDAQGNIVDDEGQASDTNADAGDLEEGSSEDEDNNADVAERGLLTDIPLVLGPDEIDALVMIIQQGIVNQFVDTESSRYPGGKNMQAVRCNILLAQDAGRNLLRELLIFIAAWDLPDDGVYFKLMMQILEAILENGLMPFAYQTFGEAKDIVSPAQSIIIKILTQIFRRKQGLPTLNEASNLPEPPTNADAPSRVEVLIVRYIFTVFRQSIIPETCALIYLQGQIRLGIASIDDFPLNLWDMERVYEGVYQFLEFFAVLTENETWKELLVKWEIVNELVTLLRELDASIPKAPLAPALQSASDGHAEASISTDHPQKSSPAPVLVERPYDPVPSDEPAPTGYDADDSPPGSPDQEVADPPAADFEWRNLKKLVVLVLSSLVWKSPTVQDQIRQYGGVEMILNCCNIDENNPYIREHAIMCLRFLLENCPRNQRIVEELQAREVVPNEVLDKEGYETFLDEEGKVGLRKRALPARLERK
ncbi:copper transport protein [Lambiella insularis]|nr:copper transport protein [Lambiella insularis]